MLYFYYITIALTLLPIHTLSSQIPVVDGVIGGVRTSTSTVTVDAVAPQVAATTPGKLRVLDNPGVCETTPGVFSATGYGDISVNESLWFWYFASRNDNETDPLALWFNGGPGSSSMLGVFQEHGPCRITNDSSSVTYNSESWNTRSNMLYIDQPVGVGWSYGTTTVGTSQEAAADVWKFLQIFFKDHRFAPLAKRTLALWTESYGGHYGPTFAAYFLSQNAAIDAGKISGIKLNLKVLGVGDGLTNPLIQYPGYISYAASNPYYPLTTSDVIEAGNTSWLEAGGCRDRITECYATGANATCSAAQSFCNDRILSPLAGNWDVYYVLTQNPDPYPPNLTTYLDAIGPQVGAAVVWTKTNEVVYDNFAATGDWMHNSAPDLETVIKAGVRTVIYDGEADYILNSDGVQAMINNLTTQYSAEYLRQPFRNYSVSGQVTGIYKNAGKFSYVKIFGAGHEVAAYTYGTLARGQAALQVFQQVMTGGPLEPT